MEKLLRKAKLIEYLITEIEIQKEEFVSRFKDHVDGGSTGFLSDIFDVFSSGKNEYKGYVGITKFKIKRRRRFFDMNMNLAVAEGTYRQKENMLIINTQINGFSGMMIPFYILTIMFYIVFTIAFVFADNNLEGTGFAFPFIIIHAAFMLGIPYFIMRRSVGRMKYELEREFYYMTKNKKPFINAIV